MKVTIDIDCTPEEARSFMGLPDVRPLQQSIMAEVERRMMAEMDRFSPESVMKTWFSAMPQSADLVQNMFSGLFGAARADNDEKPK